MTNPKPFIGSDGELLIPQPVPELKPTRSAWNAHSWLFWLGIGGCILSLWLIFNISFTSETRTLILVSGVFFLQATLVAWIILSATPTGVRKKTQKLTPETIKLPPKMLIIRPELLPLIRNKPVTWLTKVVGWALMTTIFAVFTLFVWEVALPGVKLIALEDVRAYDLNGWWVVWAGVCVSTGVFPMIFAVLTHDSRRDRFIVQNGDIIIGTAFDISKSRTSKIDDDAVRLFIWYEFQQPNGKMITDNCNLLVLKSDRLVKAEKGAQIAVLYVNKYFYKII